MIVLDTHIWIWWLDDPERLSTPQMTAISAQNNDPDGIIGVCATSLWEIAKLVELGRINLSYDLAEWFAIALAIPRVRVINLTPAIAIASTRLPDNLTREPSDRITDPSDQIITATARVYGCPLVTSDGKIVAYPGVETIR